MEKIKARINKLKEDIDACEQRESEAKASLSEANARLEAAENEKNSFLRRLKILKVEVSKTNERLEERQERLDNLETKTAVDEQAVKNLESQEVEGDEKIINLVEMIKRGQLEAEEYEVQHREAERKEVVLTRDIKRIDDLLGTKLGRIDQLMDSINKVSSNIKALEARENDQCERETENEQKLAFLAEQEKEALVRAENSERDAARLVRVIDGLEAEIKISKSMSASVSQQIEEMDGMIDDMETF